MNLSEKSKQHVDSCRFCWMCHHICPIGNATGHERSTARARALGISLVNRGAMELSEIMDNIYECSTCGGCVNVCVTGWDPVMFTRETRLQAALEGKLPAYIEKLADNCIRTGNAYGEEEIAPELAEAIADHKAQTDTLLLLGVDARFKVPDQAVKAIRVLEQAGISFDAVVAIEIPDEKIVARMGGRRVCEHCGASYHIVNIPPKTEGVCDVCGGKLVQRKDDNPETVRDRLAVYHKETEPLKGFYEARGILKTVEDQSTVAGTTQAILEALGR